MRSHRFSHNKASLLRGSPPSPLFSRCFPLSYALFPMQASEKKLLASSRRVSHSVNAYFSVVFLANCIKFPVKFPSQLVRSLPTKPLSGGTAVAVSRGTGREKVVY